MEGQIQLEAGFRMSEGDVHIFDVQVRCQSQIIYNWAKQS